MASMAVMAVVVFVALFFFKAGYGYLSTSNWGPKISNKTAWVLMEAPAFLFLLYYTVRFAMSGTDTGNCVAAAVTAGGGAVQSLQVATSWLPPGQYTVRFETEPGFSMTLQGESAANGDALGIRSSAGRRVLQGDQGDITADPGGSAEEAYAAVLADAAELTVRPDRVGGLLGAAEQVSVEYGAVVAGTAYTRLSADFRAAPESGTDPPPLTVIPEGSLTMYLDDYYRPVRIEISGLNQGIPSQLTAVNSLWGSGPLS